MTNRGHREAVSASSWRDGPIYTQGEQGSFGPYGGFLPIGFISVYSEDGRYPPPPHTASPSFSPSSCPRVWAYRDGKRRENYLSCLLGYRYRRPDCPLSRGVSPSQGAGTAAPWLRWKTGDHLRHARHLGLRRRWLRLLALGANDLGRHVALGRLGGGGLGLAAEPLGLARRHVGEQQARREGGEDDHGDQDHAAQGAACQLAVPAVVAKERRGGTRTQGQERGGERGRGTAE